MVSKSGQIGVYTCATVIALAQEHVEGDRSDIVGDRLERRVLVFIKNLHVAAALVAGFGFYHAVAAVDLLIADAFCRTARETFDAHFVPKRRAMCADGVAHPFGALPTDDHRSDRPSATNRAKAHANRNQRLSVHP